ncbi:hypothetical protein HPB49_016510 [Dermacentor silvarum]|uniref:Uncharacterized protein n=1 Tax=Dermacentor silvarum TaxID=543639 RepID=A0ACB8DQQ8_DERSI|nr:hypothetical protein HPB49_016510 [Dermacentor silvarum]
MRHSAVAAPLRVADDACFRYELDWWREVTGTKKTKADGTEALDKEASTLACSEYSQNGPEWLQVSCEESQGSVTIPHYGNEDDGLIAGVDFPEDNPPATPLTYQLNYTNALWPSVSFLFSDDRPIAMDPMFPWPADVEPNEEPLPNSPVDEPRTPSVRWAMKQQPQAERSWSLRSSDIASCSSLTPATTVSYRGSPSDSSLSAMVQNYLQDTAANKRDTHGLRQTATQGHSAVRLGHQPRTSVQDTPLSNAPPLSVQRFPPETPANRMTSIQHSRVQHNARASHPAVQQTRKVPSTPSSASSSLVDNACHPGTTVNRREPPNLQQSNAPDTITLQSSHPRTTNTASTPNSNSSLLGRNCHEDVAKREGEQPGIPQKIARDSGGSHRSLQHQRDIQATPSAQTASVATRDRLDFVKNRAESTHIQRLAEQGTRTPISSLQQRKPVSVVHTPATNIQRKGIPTILTSTPQPSIQEEGHTQADSCDNSFDASYSEVTRKSTEMTVEHPSVTEVRDMDSFFKSAWVLQLQHAHHLWLMEEIKAQVMYKPPDRFSIMSAFEDVDDHFAGHKTRGSSLPYRTLDEELQIFFSSGNSTASQDARRDTRVVSGAEGRSRKQDRETASLENSGAKKRPAAEMQGHLRLGPSMHQCRGTAEHSGHAAHRGKLLASEAETVPDSRPCSPRGSDKATLGRPAFSQESDKQRTSDCPASESDSQKRLAVKKEQGTMTSPKANLTVAESGGILQQTCTMGFQTEDTLCTAHTSFCSCSVPKVDKACQIQPQVATVGTWCDEKITSDQLQGGDHRSIHLTADDKKL